MSKDESKPVTRPGKRQGLRPPAASLEERGVGNFWTFAKPRLTSGIAVHPAGNPNLGVRSEERESALLSSHRPAQLHGDCAARMLFPVLVPFRRSRRLSHSPRLAHVGLLSVRYECATQALREAPNLETSRLVLYQ